MLDLWKWILWISIKFKLLAFEGNHLHFKMSDVLIITFRASFSLDISSRCYRRSVAKRGYGVFSLVSGEYRIPYCESALCDRFPFGVNNFPLESAIRRGKGMYVWSRSGRKIRWNLACRVNIDVILAKWHDPHGCTIEIRISRIKRALKGNDIACAIAGRFYRSAGMYVRHTLGSSNFSFIRKFFANGLE